MFERTITFCRRILGVEPYSRNVGGMREDRRQTARYRSDETVTYSATLSNGVKKLEQTATVRNVSIGGIGLLVTEQYKLGELLSIQLPRRHDDGPVTVLACVVHCQPIDEETQSIGCTFARELTEEDLASFNAEFVDRHDREEQRSQPRYMCELAAEYQVIDDPSNAVNPANVLNISTTGIGLVISESLPVGTLINVNLHHVDDRETKNLLCCVVHATDTEEQECTIGCNFINELKESVFKSLIHQ